MEESLKLPLLGGVISGGLRFGANYVVEFEPQSLWYEASLTLVAQTLKAGHKSDYHTFTHVPGDVRVALAKQGLEIARLEENDTFRIWDSYTVQGGIDVSAKIGMAQPRERVDLRSVRMSDWDRELPEELKAGLPQVDLERLHIDDNTSVLLQYNTEKEVIDHFRTITVPHARKSRLALIHSLVLGVYSENLYKQFESFCDGVIDFKSQEEGGRLLQLMRVRFLRGERVDTGWRRLDVLEDGEVEIEQASARAAMAPAARSGPTENDGASNFLRGREEIDLKRYSVTGSYLRYDESTRHLLKDLSQRLLAAFESSVPKHENYLIWAPPGSGKTAFVRHAVSELGTEVLYIETNLAETDEKRFRELLQEVDRSERPTLCFVDEIDGRQGEAWPYEALLASMDAQATGKRRVYVLAGSSAASLDGITDLISSRPKGVDILSRIPHGNEYSIPPLGAIDNVLVFLSALQEAAADSGRRINEVEKLGLYYVATSPQLGNARRLREAALRAIERVPKKDGRVKYDNLFEPGDPENKRFWLAEGRRFPDLVNSFLTLEEGQGTAPVESERRLAAIMFTDTVGSTAIAQKNEDLAIQLMEEQRELVRPLLARHRGREVKTIGDGFLVEFGSALDAVRCAVAIQSALKEANGRSPEEWRARVRIGIHLGDVMRLGSDLSGDAVNVASRIEPLAPPGGICVTAQVQASVVNKVENQFESLGVPLLKGVTSPIEVFRVVGFGEGEIRVDRGGTSMKDRIAVLPFTNISQDERDEYFADGMTEEIISSISKTQGLKVIARTSVMKYKGSSKQVSEIGRELGVGSVLEGSVRKAGDKVRISIKLVDAINEEPKWSQQYDREILDIFAIQSDIAQRVAEALRMQVLGTGEGAAKQTSSAEAYVDYLRGRQAWNKRTEEGLRQAIEFFSKAIELDGRYAKAYAGLADSYATLAFLEFSAPSEAYPRAKEAVGKALELDSPSAEAHTSLGLIRYQYDWDWKGAEGEFREATKVNPSYAPAHQYYADFLKAMGRFEEALWEITRAQELDPLNLSINTGVGHVLYLSGQIDRAIEQYKKTVELDPGFTLTHIWFGRPYLEKGMYPEAISELETAVRLSGESTLALAMLGHGLASAGRKQEALAILEKLKERSRRQYVPSYWIAAIYNGFKDKEQVISWLRKAFEERSSWLVWSNVEPRFAWLKNDPEFNELLGAMKFPPRDL